MNVFTLLQYLKNPFVLSVTLGVLVVLAYMIDAKVSSRDRDRTDYLKLFGTIVATVLGSHFYLRGTSPRSQTGGTTFYASSTRPVIKTHTPLFGSSEVYDENPTF